LDNNYFSCFLFISFVSFRFLRYSAWGMQSAVADCISIVVDSEAFTVVDVVVVVAAMVTVVVSVFVGVAFADADAVLEGDDSVWFSVPP